MLGVGGRLNVVQFLFFFLMSAVLQPDHEIQYHSALAAFAPMSQIKACLSDS